MNLLQAQSIELVSSFYRYPTPFLTKSINTKKNKTLNLNFQTDKIVYNKTNLLQEINNKTN